MEVFSDIFSEITQFLNQWRHAKILRSRALVSGQNSSLTIEAFGRRANCIYFIDECEYVMNLFQILLMIKKRRKMYG